MTLYNREISVDDKRVIISASGHTYDLGPGDTLTVRVREMEKGERAFTAFREAMTPLRDTLGNGRATFTFGISTTPPPSVARPWEVLSQRERDAWRSVANKLTAKCDECDEEI
jgi:hypothetical protein